MESHVFGDLLIDVQDTPGHPLALRWRGKGNHADPTGALRPLLDDVLRRAAGRSAPVELHFEHLSHLNSSTVTAVILFLQRARASAVPIVLSYDGRQRWQRVSFQALRALEKADGALRVVALDQDPGPPPEEPS